jgi:hypothetical protein
MLNPVNEETDFWRLFVTIFEQQIQEGIVSIETFTILIKYLYQAPFKLLQQPYNYDPFTRMTVLAVRDTINIFN